MLTFSLGDYKLPDDYFLKDLKGEGTEKSETAFRTPKDWMKRCAERLNKLQKGLDNMAKDIKVGDTVKFEGIVKDIQYDQKGEPTGYTVVNCVTNIGATIPVAVVDKVNAYPEVPVNIARLLNPNFEVPLKNDGHAVYTGNDTYLNLVCYLINSEISSPLLMDWIEEHEEEFHQAYYHGFTVIKESKYFYPVPYTNGFYYTHPDQVDHSTLLGTASCNDEPDRDFAFIYPNAVWTKEQLSARGTILSDVIEAEVDY